MMRERLEAGELNAADTINTLLGLGHEGRGVGFLVDPKGTGLRGWLEGVDPQGEPLTLDACDCEQLAHALNNVANGDAHLPVPRPEDP